MGQAGELSSPVGVLVWSGQGGGGQHQRIPDSLFSILNTKVRGRRIDGWVKRLHQEQTVRRMGLKLTGCGLRDRLSAMVFSKGSLIVCRQADSMETTSAGEEKGSETAPALFVWGY